MDTMNNSTETVVPSEQPKRNYRKVPSERAGYGPGLWVVQYYDRDMRVWFDVGDPLTVAEAQARLSELR
jgi:hypothetical protein